MPHVAPKLLTQAGYARHRGVSRPAVARAVREGRITLAPGGLIDPVAADAQWDANTRPRAGTKEQPTAPEAVGTEATMSYKEATRRRAVADMLQAERAEREQAGELIRVQAVRDVLALDYATTREAIMQMPARMAPLLAAETDPAAVERILSVEIHQALSRLAGSADAVGADRG